MSKLALKLRGDWKHRDDVETLTHLHGQHYSGFAKATRDEVTFREVATSGAQPTDTVWELWDETVGQEPVQGDILVDSQGESWSVLSLTAKRIGGMAIFWRCVCRRQVTA